MKKENYDFVFRICLEFPSNSLAKKAMASVFPKPKAKRSHEKRSITEVSVKKNCLAILVKAKDKSALKAGLNSHLKLVGLASEILGVS